MEIEPLVAPLRADVVSGAAQVARAASRAFGRAAAGAEAGSAEELFEQLGRLARGILDAQPAMAPLVALGSAVLEAVDGEDDLEAARAAAGHAAEGFRDRLREEARGVAEAASALLEDRMTVLTHSHSSTVLAALDLGQGRELTVICLESRPLNEGRRLAERLAGLRGTRVLYAVDAAGWGLAGGADLVLLGADSVGDAGVANKIGTCALAGAARSRGTPVHVLAGRSKLLPPGFPQDTDDARPPGEVWKAPPGVRVWNRYFEILPVETVTSVVTDEGAREPATIRSLREDLPVPGPLRRWAEERGRP